MKLLLKNALKMKYPSIKNSLGFNLILYQNFKMNFVSTEIFTPTRNFKVKDSSQTGKSVIGLLAGKRPRSGFTKSFSMKHNLRRFKINVQKILLYSNVLEKQFKLDVTTKALKSIKLHGNLDNYLLQTDDKKLDSDYARYLKRLIKYINSENLSNESKSKLIRNCQLIGVNTVKKLSKFSSNYYKPSIYIPPETLKTDLSTVFYTKEKFISRLENQKIEELKKEIEVTTDYDKRNLLKEELNVLNRVGYEDPTKDLLSLQPIRHKLIRDELLKLRNTYSKKQNYLKILNESEEYCKEILKEKYKHFSEEYPEVQLLLKEFDIEKKKS